jgi:hypothetical protein
VSNLPCEQCGGTGFEIISRDGREFAQACTCRRTSSLVGPGGDPALGCRIPPRYEHCTLESFEPGNASLSASLEKAMAKVLAAKDLREKLEQSGVEMAAPADKPVTPAQFAKILDDDIAKWARIVKASGATVN